MMKISMHLMSCANTSICFPLEDLYQEFNPAVLNPKNEDMCISIEFTDDDSRAVKFYGDLPIAVNQLQEMTRRLASYPAELIFRYPEFGELWSPYLVFRIHSPTDAAWMKVVVLNEMHYLPGSWGAGVKGEPLEPLYDLIFRNEETLRKLYVEHEYYPHHHEHSKPGEWFEWHTFNPAGFYQECKRNAEMAEFVMREFRLHLEVRKK